NSDRTPEKPKERIRPTLAWPGEGTMNRKTPVLPKVATLGMVFATLLSIAPTRLVGEAAAAVLFVNPTDLTCGGNAPCFNVIQPAVDAAQPGDTVRLQAGTYTETFSVNMKNNTGTPTEASRIVIEADPDAAVGSVVMEGAGADCDAGYAIRFRQSKFVTIRGLTINDAAGKAILLVGGPRRNDSIQIERNRILANRCGPAILIARGNTTTIVANNLIYSSAGSGVDMKGSGGM